MNLRPVPVVVLVLLAALGVLSLGVTGAPLAPITDDAAADAAVAPTAGGHVCVTGAGPAEPDAALLLLAAVDDGADASPARGTVLTLGPEPARRSFGPSAPGSLEVVDVELGEEGWVFVGWADRAVAAWQEWRTEGAPGQPRGVAASTCLPTDPPLQTILGMRTDGGFEALLRLANPFEVDATFAVTLLLEDEVVEPVVLRNVSVPAGERVTVRLNNHLPEVSDVAVIVTVGAGRLAVEGLQRAVAAVGGIEGVAVLTPITAPSVTWTFPWLPVGPDADGSVWVLNPEPRPVVVELTLHTPQGATVPLEESVEVPAGAVVRLDTADLVSDGARTSGLTLRSETTGILASAGGAFLSGDPARTGLVALAGAPVPDAEWAVAGAVLDGRDTVLHVVNLDEVVASPRVVLTTVRREVAPVGEDDDLTDEDVREADGAGAGEEQRTTVVIEPGTLAPGATLRIPLPVDGAHAFSAVVDGGRALVVMRTTSGRELLEPVAVAASPSSAWRLSGRSLSGRPLDGWVASLGAGAAGEDGAAGR